MTPGFYLVKTDTWAIEKGSVIHIMDNDRIKIIKTKNSYWLNKYDTLVGLRTQELIPLSKLGELYYSI